MLASRVQPVTVILVSVGAATIEAWSLLVVFGSVMLLGACNPQLSLLDRWVSLISRAQVRTTLYPKRFAAGMGGSMLLVAGLIGGAHGGAALTLVALTVAAASLQATFNLCVGCWVYNGIVVPLMGQTPSAQRH